MRTTISYDLTFEAAHYLPHVPEGHRCRRMHGHNYKVRLSLAGEPDEKFGWVRDFGEIEAVALPLVALVDHHLLNEVDGLQNPTAEMIAAWFFARLEKQLPELSHVEVHENAQSRARVSRPHQK